MRSGRILVIEDDQPSQANLRLILELEGYAVVVAGDGEAGWREMRTQVPDLVVCDILMPGLSGLELLARVRGDATLADIPFVFLTALGSMRQLREGMNLGADDYLAKPFDPHELVEVIELRLRQSRRRMPANVPPAVDLRRLSRREREVFDMIGRGLSSKEIAVRLNLSPRTVDTHRASLLRKLDMTNGMALIQLATRVTQSG